MGLEVERFTKHNDGQHWALVDHDPNKWTSQLRMRFR